MLMQTDDDKKARRGIYLLPNLFTTGTLFAGFYAIVAAMNDRFETAAVAVFVALVLDGIDGRVARMTQTQSAFGAQYDSLADLVAFGLAPALVMYEWALSHMAAMGWFWAKLGWLAAFFYAASAALRLARFNIRIEVADRKFFQGLPSPSAAALMMGTVWVWQDLQFAGNDLVFLAFAMTLIAGGLMVSNVRYYSFKDFDLRDKVPFVAILAVVLAFILASIDPPKVLFTGFAIYAASGPVLSVLRRRRRKRAQHTVPPE